MTYATQQDMIDRYGSQELTELTDRSSAGVIDVVVLGKALADSDAEIDAYLQSRYSLPLATVPLVLTRFAADIARYMLYDTRAPEAVKLRYDAAVKFLQMVSAGKASLGLDRLAAGGVGIAALAHPA